MEVRFKSKRILQLYETGQHKKYPLQHSVLKKFFMRIQQLEAAATIHDLWKTSSLNFEHLDGHKTPYSIRIDQKWRLEFDVDWTNKEKTVGIIHICEISKHYGD